MILPLLDPWEASYARSRARRAGDVTRGQAPPGGAGAAVSPIAVGAAGAVRGRGAPGTSPRRDPWELSLGRSRARRRAEQLRFVPAGSRAKRISLGALVALTRRPGRGPGRRQRLRPPRGRAADDDRTHHRAERRQRRPAGATAAAGAGHRGRRRVRPRNRRSGAEVPGHHGLMVDGIVGPRRAPRCAGAHRRARRWRDVASGEASSSGEGSEGGSVARLQSALHLTPTANSAPKPRRPSDGCRPAMG